MDIIVLIQNEVARQRMSVTEAGRTLLGHYLALHKILAGTVTLREASFIKLVKGLNIYRDAAQLRQWLYAYNLYHLGTDAKRWFKTAGWTLEGQTAITPQPVVGQHTIDPEALTALSKTHVAAERRHRLLLALSQAEDPMLLNELAIVGQDTPQVTRSDLEYMVHRELVEVELIRDAGLPGPNGHTRTGRQSAWHISASGQEFLRGVESYQRRVS